MAGVEPLSLLAALYVAHNLRDANRREIEATAGPVSAEAFAINRLTAEGEAWAFVDGLPYMIAGIEVERPGVATWWLAATPLVEKHAKTAVRFGRNVVTHLLTTGEFHRIQAYCLADWPQAGALAEAIGLRREAVLRAAGIGKQDIAVYAAT